MTNGGSVMLRAYFVLVTFVSLMMLVFSVSDLINVGLKTYVFRAADRPEYAAYCDMENQTREQCDALQKSERDAAIVRKQQSAVRDISVILVGAPLFWLHWRIVYRDWLWERREKNG